MSAKDHVHEPPKPEQPCPCGTGKTFGTCCRPILKRERAAASATELMRSRFSAHVVFDWEHLHRSCLETSTQPFEKQPDEGHTHWTRLAIHEEAPGAKPDTATVDFTAYFLENDVERAFHEKAEFLKQAEGWIYVRPLRQGPAPIRGGQAKAGRNDPCPCGSGKKYKQCCLNK